MHKRIEFKSNQTLLFIGDSITDCGRRELAYAPLGCGYVNFAANFLLAERPALNLNIENRGIGGDTTRDLLARWKQDCIAVKPDIVSIMIGINDLWYKYGESYESQQCHVPAAEYERNLGRLLTEVQDKCGSQLILMEPYMFCDDSNDPMLKDLEAYIEIVHRLSMQFEAIMVPIQSNFIKLKDRQLAIEWAVDTVHPLPWAHAWIAKQWLDTVIGID